MRRRSAPVRAAALPRRPTMLLLLLCLLPAVSTETTSNVLFKPINETCPDAGYFFERASAKGLEPAPCYLCFCKGDDHAVCSLRADGRCDKRLYIHQKRETKRVRRANGGMFGDIFFRDAAREIFNRNLQQREDCKPHSSKSIGCPPADWCTGCMVCDCDANGHWDCHLMSFCDKNAKSKSVKKTKKTHPKNPFDARQVQKSSLKKSNQGTGKRNTNSKPAGKRIIKKSVNNPIAMPQISVSTKKGLRRKDQPDKPLVIKKYVSTSSPIKSSDLLKHKNNTSKLAQMLYRQYLSSMNKEPNKIRKRTITDKNMGDKIFNKKGLLKKNIKPSKIKSKKAMNTKVHKYKPKVMKNKQGKKKNGSKKQIKKSSSFKGKKYMASKFNTSKRNKRDVSLATELSVNFTKLERTATANISAYDEQYSNATEVSFTVSEDIQTNLNNYAYTVDNHVTASMENNNQTFVPLYNVSGYVTTERHLDIITIDDKNFTTRNGVKVNLTATEMPLAVINTTDQKIITVYDDILKKTQFMNDQNFKLNVTIENTTNYISQSDTLNQDGNKKVLVQEIRKMNFGRKKFNLKKLVKTLNSRIKFTKDNYNFVNKSFDDAKSTRIKIDGTLNDIQNLLERMLHGVDKNKKTKERLKTKSFTAIKYLKKLFSKLFSKSKNKTTVQKVAVMDSICESFGPCRISTKKLGVVNFKVKELISETLRALSSIKIIKGILQLFDDHNIKKANTTSKEPDFKMHLKNLNDILKDKFSTEDKLTQTQLTQINYIKSNTQIFIKSIGKFATILNDIIGIIKSENEKYNLKQDAIIKERNKIIKKGDSISKMKRLLLRYNLLQNTFLRKMYEALTNVEEKVKTERVKKFQYKNTSVINTTYKMAIEKYVDNINNNLKKLKDIAAKMDSNTRRKRDTRDDDAIEYLLTLMEYLLKKNNPLDTPPGQILYGYQIPPSPGGVSGYVGLFLLTKTPGVFLHSSMGDSVSCYSNYQNHVDVALESTTLYLVSEGTSEHFRGPSSSGHYSAGDRSPDPSTAGGIRLRYWNRRQPGLLRRIASEFMSFSRYRSAASYSDMIVLLKWLTAFQASSLALMAVTTTARDRSCPISADMAARVNDGIDLLIEAIRRAPDIKPIQKPVLQYVPIKIPGATSSAVSREDNDSKSKNENSKEDMKNNANYKSEEDTTDIDIIHEDRRAPTKITIDVTTKRIQNFADLSDVITEYPSKVYMATFNTYENTERLFNDRTTAIIPSIRKNDDSDTIIMDDDNFRVQKAEIDLETGIQSGTTTAPTSTENRIEGPNMRQFIPINKQHPGTTIKEPKTKLDLINEAYEQEIKEQKEHVTLKPNPKASVVIRVKGETGKRDPKATSADISSITKEIVDEEKEKPIDAEKVVYRKQMDLLNSLDYGTDRSLIEDSDSKDNSPVDRLTNEAFPAY